MTRLRLSFFLALLCALLSFSVNAAELTASVDRTQLSEGESVELTVESNDVTLFGKPDHGIKAI